MACSNVRELHCGKAPPCRRAVTRWRRDIVALLRCRCAVVFGSLLLGPRRNVLIFIKHPILRAHASRPPWHRRYPAEPICGTASSLAAVADRKRAARALLISSSDLNVPKPGMLSRSVEVPVVLLKAAEITDGRIARPGATKGRMPERAPARPAS